MRVNRTATLPHLQVLQTKLAIKTIEPNRTNIPPIETLWDLLQQGRQWLVDTSFPLLFNERACKYVVLERTVTTLL